MRGFIGLTDGRRVSMLHKLKPAPSRTCLRRDKNQAVSTGQGHTKPSLRQAQVIKNLHGERTPKSGSSAGVSGFGNCLGIMFGDLPDGE